MPLELWGFSSAVLRWLVIEQITNSNQKSIEVKIWIFFILSKILLKRNWASLSEETGKVQSLGQILISIYVLPVRLRCSALVEHCADKSAVAGGAWLREL